MFIYIQKTNEQGILSGMFTLNTDQIETIQDVLVSKNTHFPDAKEYLCTEITLASGQKRWTNVPNKELFEQMNAVIFKLGQKDS